ncbi:MAG: hypothetical protein KME32_17320 [Mojavia pulchra JT2-VF2]|uniref:Uncharacterized protein n=1 Tax=Mojavia pulchra JT2-VF2 TaxID=287848 RepID=A0A951Q0C5_9NOST|nr:hypothetical protein [Mojavia pulchra JT2-VF2]
MGNNSIVSGDNAIVMNILEQVAIALIAEIRCM